LGGGATIRPEATTHDCSRKVKRENAIRTHGAKILRVRKSLPVKNTPGRADHRRPLLGDGGSSMGERGEEEVRGKGGGIAVVKVHGRSTNGKKKRPKRSLGGE